MTERTAEPVPASEPARDGVARRAAPFVAVARRLPFTTAVVLVMLVAGIATGALWSPVTERPWFGWIAYGVPSLADGHWWTPVTGAFFALTPLFYLPMVGSFALLVGFAEWKLGTRRAALITVAGHLVGRRHRGADPGRLPRQRLAVGGPRRR